MGVLVILNPDSYRRNVYRIYIFLIGPTNVSWLVPSPYYAFSQTMMAELTLPGTITWWVTNLMFELTIWWSRLTISSSVFLGLSNRASRWSGLMSSSITTTRVTTGMASHSLWPMHPQLLCHLVRVTHKGRRECVGWVDENRKKICWPWGPRLCQPRALRRPLRRRRRSAVCLAAGWYSIFLHEEWPTQITRR